MKTSKKIVLHSSLAIAIIFTTCVIYFTYPSVSHDLMKWYQTNIAPHTLDSWLIIASIIFIFLSTIGILSPAFIKEDKLSDLKVSFITKIFLLLTSLFCISLFFLTSFICVIQVLVIILYLEFFPFIIFMMITDKKDHRQNNVNQKGKRDWGIAPDITSEEYLTMQENEKKENNEINN